jgi:sugar phosphate permease
MMMKRTSPSLWLCIIMLAWGVAMTLMGLVKDFKSLLVVRMALGLAEGGLFPGVTWYITLWYRRHECGLRMAIFFSAATLAGAFGGLLARGISEMRGVGGRPGWAWIFILEGIATIVVAFFARWIIHDSPETAKFLTEEERTEVISRLKLDRTSLADEYHIKYLFAALKDWKIYVHMLITIGIYTPLYSISLFLPTIIKNMGYTNNKSQLMSVPPYVVGCIATISAGYAADKYKKRGPFMMLHCVIAIVGFVLLISTKNPHVQYAGTFFAVSGIYPNVPMGVAWNGNNIGGSTKRAVGIAMHVGFGNLGGVISAFAYRSKDAPRYFSGHGLLIATVSMSFLLCAFMHLYLVKENARRDAEMQTKGLTLESYTEEMKHSEREKGDYATFFRYTI